MQTANSVAFRTAMGVSSKLYAAANPGRANPFVAYAAKHGLTFDDLPRNRLDADKTGKPIVGLDEEEPPRRNLLMIIARIAAKCTAEEWAELQNSFRGFADTDVEGEGEEDKDDAPLQAADSRIAEILSSVRLPVPKQTPEWWTPGVLSLDTAAGALKYLSRISAG